jgi:hypothetical protein
MKWYRAKLKENDKPAWFRRVLQNGASLFIVAYKGGDLRYKFRLLWEGETKSFIKMLQSKGEWLGTKHSEELERAFWNANLGIWTHKGSETIQEERRDGRRFRNTVQKSS